QTHDWAKCASPSLNARTGHGERGRPVGILPRGPGELQDPAAGPLRRRVAHERHRQDPAVLASRTGAEGECMELAGIDIHVHPRTEQFIAASGARAEQMAAYFGREVKPVSFDELADQYRARNMMAALMNSVDEATSGIPPVPNDVIAAAVKKHPDV